MPFSTRPAAEGDAPALARIYAAAGAMFAGTRHAAAAEGPPPDPAAFARLAAEGRILAACTPEGAVAGFLGHLPATLADGRPCLHVAELDMDPAHQRRGGARALLEAAAGLARAEGRVALTLTTFADIPWNAPLYRRLGFAEIPRADWPPVCRGETDRIAAAGMDARARVAMIRPV